jgi:hypothetical protein
VKIEIDPLRGGAPLRTAEQPAVEGARLVQAGDGKRKMEWHDRHGVAPDKKQAAVYTQKPSAKFKPCFHRKDAKNAKEDRISIALTVHKAEVDILSPCGARITPPFSFVRSPVFFFASFASLR